jgi:hypothetical protein
MTEANSQGESRIGSNAGEALYLFCFARASLLPPGVEGIGVDDLPAVFLWDFLGIAAVLSAISLEEFCGPAAEAKMQELAWVGPRVCRHERVVEQVMRYSPVLPARFGTIFSSRETLEMLLKKHHRAISRSLDRMADQEEWAVKVLLRRAKAREELFSVMRAEREPDLSSLSPGMRHLAEQRIRASSEQQLTHWLKETCQRIASHLNRHGSDYCQRKVITRRAVEGDFEVLYNWAFLLPRSIVAVFQAEIDRMNTDHTPRGLVLELSGPWPPYSFGPSLE